MKNYFGQNIRRRRLELGLSQAELANRLGYSSRSAIAKIESGESDTFVSRIYEIARVLDVTAADLVSVNSPGNVGHDNSQSNHGSNMGKTAAVVLAGGKSSRNERHVPNQFVEVLGKPLIAHCLETYAAHPLIDAILVVCLADWEDIALSLSAHCCSGKFIGVVTGGDTGVRSALAGYEALIRAGYTVGDRVIFQESTRPLTPPETISKVLSSCAARGHAVACERRADSAQFYIESRHARLLDGDRVVDLQSPDAYAFDVLSAVFDKARVIEKCMDRSCLSLMLDALGYELNFVECGRGNIKAVRREDLSMIAALLRRRGGV